MSQEVNFAETTCDRIIRFLKQWDSGNYFKDFIYGDDSDLEIPTDSQPCVIVDLMDTSVEQGPTATDNVTERIKVIIVLNKLTYMDDFGGNDDTLSWKKKLELMVQGNDPVTKQYDPTTILGVLRTNFTLGQYALNQKVAIKYGELPRNGVEQPTTGEAHITLTIDHHQLTPAKV